MELDRNPYEILQVAPGAAPEVIHAALKALSKKYHPDSGTEADAERMATINEAYTVLSDPERRAELDRQLARRGAAAEPATGQAGWGEAESHAKRWGEPSRVRETDVGATVDAAPLAAAVPWNARPPAPGMDAHQHGWLQADQLATALHRGATLPTMRTSMVLEPGEQYHFGAPVGVAAFHGADVDYNTGWLVAGRGLTGVAVTAGASMLYNSHQRRKAERAAAPQWRGYGVLPVHLTTNRLVIIEQGQFNTHWIKGGIAVFEPYFTQYRALLHPDGGNPIMLEGPAVPYLSVLVSVLLRGEVPMLSEHSR
jgi:curved DNA-binding protein CbpA